MHSIKAQGGTCMCLFRQYLNIKFQMLNVQCFEYPIINQRLGEC